MIDKLGVTTIEFGSGGGFTGKYTTYVLDLKQKTVVLSNDETIKIKTKDLKPILKMLEETDFSSFQQNEPGNMNEFLTINSKEPINFIWVKNADIPQEIKNLYLKLKTLTIHEKN